MSFWKRFVAHNSEIIRPILTLGVGSVCAQLIPFVMSFVLARLYSPEAFGELGLFVNYAGILLIIASARYELAIVRARTPSEAASVSFLSAGIAFLLCLFLTILISITDYADGNIFEVYPEDTCCLHLSFFPRCFKS